MFRSHVIGSEPIAINRAQILRKLRAATENFIEKPDNTVLLDPGIKPNRSLIDLLNNNNNVY